MVSKINVFLLSGLGADERLFHYLDLSPYQVTTIRWLPPLKNETISDYARRLAPQIPSTDGVLIGVSFGGMVAVELGQIIPTRKIILISSAASRTELRRVVRWIGATGVNRLVTGGMMKRSHRLLNFIMGAKDPVRRGLLADMLRDSNESFLSWAIDKVVNWKNTQIPPNVVRIHGSRDPVLPLRKADYVVKKGGHLIVCNRAKEVSGYLHEIIAAV